MATIKIFLYKNHYEKKSGLGYKKKLRRPNMAKMRSINKWPVVIEVGTVNFRIQLSFFLNHIIQMI